MPVLSHLLLTAAGLALLVGGGEALVRGATRLATAARISPAIVGATVVAAGTSLPELIVTLRAAWAGSASLAIGNVIGSNTFNLAVVLGVAALLRPVELARAETIRDGAAITVAAVVGAALLSDGALSRGDGLVLLGLLVCTLVVSLRVKTGNDTASAQPADSRPDSRALVAAGGLVVLGCALLAGGAEATVKGATLLARTAGLSDRLIGLTIVAAGTSLPELMTSALAAVRGHHGVAVGNVFGSNVFNMLGILGASAVLRPLSVGNLLVERDLPVMVTLTVLVAGVLIWRHRLGRIIGLLLLVAYAIAMWFSATAA